MKKYEELDEILEEFLEEHMNVKDILVEMKNISELMVDLAYSAILFNNDELAEEVHELEERMNKLRYQVEIGAMLAARTPEQAVRLEGILHVAAAAERISNAAKEMAEVVLRDIEVDPVLKAALTEADEVVVRIIVSRGSKLVGMAVGDVRRNTKYGMDVISIRRGARWIFDPKDDVKIKARDVLILSGPREGAEHLRSMSKSS